MSASAQSAATRLPEVVGLCPNPAHTGEFYMPHGGGCPLQGCGRALIEYRPSGLSEDELRILLHALLKTALGDDASAALYAKLSGDLRRHRS